MSLIDLHYVAGSLSLALFFSYICVFLTIVPFLRAKRPHLLAIGLLVLAESTSVMLGGIMVLFGLLRTTYVEGFPMWLAYTVISVGVSRLVLSWVVVGFNVYYIMRRLRSGRA